MNLKKYLTVLTILFTILNCDFSNAQEFAPKNFSLKNTSWYMNINYKKSLSRDGNELSLILNKEKTPYRIDFINDKKYKVSFIDKNKKTQVFTGDYQFSRTYENNNIIEFDYDNFSNLKDKKGNPIELVKSPFISFLEIMEFEKIQIREKLQFLFSRSYLWEESQNTLFLDTILLRKDKDYYEKINAKMIE